MPRIAFIHGPGREAAVRGCVASLGTRLQRINSARKIAIILHQEHSTPGRLGRLLKMQGFELDIRRPRFGGPMSANDEEDWLRSEIDWIEVPLREEKPFLGICLGAQMLARHLGQRVYAYPEGKVEVGYYPIHPTREGHAVCAAPFPEKVYQWHREGFDLPRGSALLAAGQEFETQAFCYGPAAYGIQFHPEVTYAMMCCWTIRGMDRMQSPGAHPRHCISKDGTGMMPPWRAGRRHF